MTDDGVLVGDVKVGRNEFYAGARITDRSSDGSLDRAHRAARAVPPDSLLWKYYGDYRTLFFAFTMAGLQNLWPQLAQGVSDHSTIFSPQGFLQRVQRSHGEIGNALYASADDALPRGVRIRNYHKAVKGDMPEGGSYRALDPETFYWAHATFVMWMYRMVELLYAKPMSAPEKEQLFAESRAWFSTYAVDDSAQPATYAEFVDYWDRAVQDELVDSKIGQYSFGFATGKFFAPPLPPLVGPLLWRRVTRFVRLTNLGALDPVLRERLGLEWTAADERSFQRFCRLMRAVAPVYERLPLVFRYQGFALRAFRREGLDPSRITLRSARRASAVTR